MSTKHGIELIIMGLLLLGIEGMMIVAGIPQLLNYMLFG